MEIIGIIGEYNPFHNGHIYHINQIKKMYSDSIIILVLNGYFLERGQISIESIESKTKLALKYGVDIVINLPFIFGSNSADIFADASIELLNEMKINKLVFGSECNDVNYLMSCANKQLDNEYNNLVKDYLNSGFNYPTALNKSLNININTPNDLLGLSYIKSIIKNKYDIEPITIKRTNNYHDINSNDLILSATNIREKINNNINIDKYLPNKELINKINYDLYFKLLKYKILTSDISKYLTVDEGIDNKLRKVINDVNNINDLIDKVKTKRYTYNKINRMFIHILIGLTKEDKFNIQRNEYIRLLGFSISGQKYLNTIKNKTNLPILTKLTNIKSTIKNYDIKAYQIYNMLVNENIFKYEEKNKPIKNI